MCFLFVLTQFLLDAPAPGSTLLPVFGAPKTGLPVPVTFRGVPLMSPGIFDLSRSAVASLVVGAGSAGASPVPRLVGHLFAYG